MSDDSRIGGAVDSKPFRWNMTNRRALMGMLERARVPASANARPSLDDMIKSQTVQDQSFAEPLLDLSARILGYAAGTDLVFVGRSPESIFDLMSGLLYDTKFKSRLILLHFSMRFYAGVRIDWQKARPAIRSYFTMLRLDPASIAKRARPVCFVDLVSEGITFRNLAIFLEEWALDVGVEWSRVRKRVRITGICRSERPSPKTIAWNEQKNWGDRIPSRNIKNIVIDPRLWDYLGNRQLKSTTSFSPNRWGQRTFYSPVRNVSTLTGLCSALSWFELGSSRESRKSFASRLSQTDGMKETEIRVLVLQLRQTRNKTPRSRSGSRAYPRR